MYTTDPLLSQMKTRADRWKSEGDHRHIFLRCYSMMTGNMMQGIKAHRFKDEGWVSHLLHRFAAYYLDALEKYEAQDEQTPAVWKQVHDASRTQQLHVLQHLLLGINAHINYDLVLAIYDAMEPDWAGLSLQKLEVRMNDHDLVNRIIRETIDTVQDEVIEREAPFMKVVDSLMGRVDEWLLAELITNWRTDVWNESCAMLAAENDHEREKLRITLEERVMSKANQLLEF